MFKWVIPLNPSTTLIIKEQLAEPFEETKHFYKQVIRKISMTFITN